jgi:nitroimidazol reductase NimA-like FMN-containing flavoprotein (pyridoxamine 5'-phosphate oxidase superfamily)
MMIHVMSEEESYDVLAHTRLCRLACARDNQPYVVPTVYAYHKSTSGVSYLYVITTLGQKVHWMRTNPLVCVECDEVTSYDQWMSVVGFGVYEELPDDSGFGQERLHAWELLHKDPTWWMPGWAAYAGRDHPDPTQPFSPLYYRIRIDHITGHRAVPDAAATAVSITSAPVQEGEGWLRKALRRIAGKITSWTHRSPENHRNDALGSSASNDPSWPFEGQTLGSTTTRKSLNYRQEEATRQSAP